MIDTFKELALLAAAICLLAIAGVCVQTIIAEQAITRAVEQIPATVDARLAAIQQQTLDLVDRHAKHIEATVDGAVRTADSRLASLQDEVHDQLGQTNRSVATVTAAAASEIPKLSASISQSSTALLSSIDQVAQPAGSLVRQVDEAAPLFLDCDHNPDCAFNRFQGTSKAIEKSAHAFATNAPAIARSTAQLGENAARISDDVRREVDVLTKPKHWYSHIFEALRLATRLI